MQKLQKLWITATVVLKKRPFNIVALPNNIREYQNLGRAYIVSYPADENYTLQGFSKVKSGIGADTIYLLKDIDTIWKFSILKITSSQHVEWLRNPDTPFLGACVLTYWNTKPITAIIHVLQNSRFESYIWLQNFIINNHKQEEYFFNFRL